MDDAEGADVMSPGDRSRERRISAGRIRKENSMKLSTRTAKWAGFARPVPTAHQREVPDRVVVRKVLQGERTSETHSRRTVSDRWRARKAQTLDTGRARARVPGRRGAGRASGAWILDGFSHPQRPAHLQSRCYRLPTTASPRTSARVQSYRALMGA